MIILYSTDCPKCNILEKKLTLKGLEFQKQMNFDPKELINKGFFSAPVCYINGTYYDYKGAINYINNL